MTTFGNWIANILTPGPEPAARRTILIDSTTPATGAFKQGRHLNMADRMTHTTVKAIFEQIEADPLAGMGTISKRDRFIDAIVAHHNLVMAQYVNMPTTPAPIMTEPTGGAAAGKREAEIVEKPSATTMGGARAATTVSIQPGQRGPVVTGAAAHAVPTSKPGAGQ
jgi:hypothetical protein